RCINIGGARLRHAEYIRAVVLRHDAIAGRGRAPVESEQRTRIAAPAEDVERGSAAAGIDADAIAERATLAVPRIAPAELEHAVDATQDGGIVSAVGVLVADQQDLRARGVGDCEGVAPLDPAGGFRAAAVAVIDAGSL